MEINHALASVAFPLTQGERIEVRGFEMLQGSTAATLTLPSPFGRERQSGDIDVKRRSTHSAR